MTMLFDIDINLRPEVLAFARLMELRLREKDAECGTSWKQASRGELILDASSKCNEMEINHINIRHPVDLANYCMMIADVSGALEPGVSDSGGAGWAELDEVKAHG